MSQDGAVQTPSRNLEPTQLNLNENEAQFFKDLTGIQDDKELKQHILNVQAKAYEVEVYNCIYAFGFTTLQISKHPVYKSVLELSRSRPKAILLDIGCCVGTDLRKAVVDGWPVENAIASDLCPEFWDCGHELFKSTPETFPAAFIPGDSFSSALIEPRDPFYSEPSTTRPIDLRTLESLTPLQGHISVVHASLFFHLFDEEKQLVLAKQLATLLSPQPGSVIFGFDRGKSVKGLRTEAANSRGSHLFCHSPESWADLWYGEVFKQGSIRVETKLLERVPRVLDPPGVATSWLVWSVTRL